MNFSFYWRQYGDKSRFLHNVLDQISPIDDITYRSMMGEYILYYKGKLIAYLYDNRLLVKPTKGALAYIKAPIYEPPYAGAKDMLLVENIDKNGYLSALFDAFYVELPFPKRK